MSDSYFRQLKQVQSPSDSFRRGRPRKLPIRTKSTSCYQVARLLRRNCLKIERGVISVRINLPQGDLALLPVLKALYEMVFTALLDRFKNRTERSFTKLNAFESTEFIWLFDKLIEVKLEISPMCLGTRVINGDWRMFKYVSGTLAVANASSMLSATGLSRSVFPTKLSVFNAGSEAAGKSSGGVPKPKQLSKVNCSAFLRICR